MSALPESCSECSNLFDYFHAKHAPCGHFRPGEHSEESDVRICTCLGNLSRLIASPTHDNFCDHCPQGKWSSSIDGIVPILLSDLEFHPPIGLCDSERTWHANVGRNFEFGRVLFCGVRWFNFHGELQDSSQSCFMRAHTTSNL